MRTHVLARWVWSSLTHHVAYLLCLPRVFMMGGVFQRHRVAPWYQKVDIASHRHRHDGFANGQAVRQWVLGSYLMAKEQAAGIALYQLLAEVSGPNRRAQAPLPSNMHVPLCVVSSIPPAALKLTVQEGSEFGYGNWSWCQPEWSAAVGRPVGPPAESAAGLWCALGHKF